MKPTYFDLTVHDLGLARTFFENVLGWQFEKFDMPYEYFRIRTGPEELPGIDGGMGAISDAPLSEGRPMTLVTIPVTDLEATLARVTSAGGRIVEPRIRIPGVGWFATCAEPGGLKFGLIQADTNAEHS